MERLKLRYDDCKRSLKTLQEILEEDFSTIVRDATIQRFEYTFEAFWKFVKEYLRAYEGIECNSPKRCFRELFSAGGYIAEEETIKSLEMTDDRNLTSHVYKEDVAQALFQKVPEYYKLMSNTLKKLEKFMNSTDM